LEDNSDQHTSPAPDETNEHDNEEPDAFDIFGTANNTTDQPTNSELEDYLQGKYPAKKDQTPLGWWKVRFTYYCVCFHNVEYIANYLFSQTGT
jgi:hypothetical protein